MNLIVVFNYNYSQFFEKLFESFVLNNVVNNKNFKIVLCDDGSSDESLNVANDIKIHHSISNLDIISVRPYNSSSRSIRSFGQIEALMKVEKEYLGDLSSSDLIFLTDADDFYPEDYFTSVVKAVPLSHASGYMASVENVSPLGEFLSRKEIVRPIGKNRGIWPTITCTSGITVTKEFFYTNRDALLDINPIFSDVWLDSRICMIANSRANFRYLDNKFFRVIHGANDSTTSNYKRKLLKQVQAARFYMKCSNSLGIRVRLLHLIGQVFKV
ncbi:glycosyltransferase [Vibrio parahaemolyticus]